MSARRWRTPRQVAERRIDLLDREVMSRIVKGQQPTVAQKQKREELEQRREAARSNSARS